MSDSRNVDQRAGESGLARSTSAPAAETSARPRVGVLVVAYNAATTLVATLDRLPESFTDSLDHIMVCDDASADDTYEIGLAYQKRSTLPLTVVKHPRNLGYGGNQKAGYKWAIEHGLDIVVLLHGDGQYAPEIIEDVVAPLLAGEADAVFGSRMMEKGLALKGGMPMYKYVGNRILTTMQNTLAGTRLTEWHSGYRAYRTSALASLDLDSYTDEFDFDTEIILGLVSGGHTIKEVPIPTYYGDEICYVNGLKYARDVTADMVRFKARNLGLTTSLTTDTTRLSVVDDSAAYALKPSPHSSHGQLLAWLTDHAPARVLDVGCSDGAFGKLARQHGHHVTGVDIVTLPGVHDNLDVFHEIDLTRDADAIEGTYDFIVAGDVLEHVTDPHALLSTLATKLNPGGEILISIPNFGHWYPRTRTALGLFDYDERGPLDVGHVRFFTRRSFDKLIKACNLHTLEATAVPSPTDVLTRTTTSSKAKKALQTAGRIDNAATKAWPTLFGYQFLYRLTTK